MLIYKDFTLKILKGKKNADIWGPASLITGIENVTVPH